MTHSPTPAELAALRVGNAALLASADSSCDIVATVVFALGSAQLLQSPEVAAELENLRVRNAELEQATADRGANAVEQSLRTAEQGNSGAAFTHDCNLPLARRLDCGHCPHELCADCGRCPHSCRCAAGGAPAVEALHAASGAVIEPRGPREDPHDSPLHSDYRLSHDLPETPGGAR